ncbi:XRE family transcriptional regulator [Marinobacter sp. R17]|uniref:helix-turn-helix domain-containing protein n=1 Tax=Marinobacter sp. R17 TaxID=2484250 RepID=UPI000F4B166D|nr:helix-turn-helix transcriptional regulator [Marinobacter sp. R17]ROT96157.1 XRE family transcriptional regulator [Marinobacter sp. R17]
MKSITDVSDVLQAQRKKLGLSQKDMLMRIGMSQQQYQKIESGSDMRLSTLLRVLEGMGLELTILPQEQARTLPTVPDGQESDEPEQTSVWSSELDDLKDRS